MRILYVVMAGSFLNFFRETIPFLREKGIQIDVAGNLSNKKIPSSIEQYIDKSYDIPLSRKPLSKNNYFAYKEIRKILNNQEYDIVHFHTPICGVVGRIAKKSSKNNTKTIYTPHGFDFNIGGNIKGWLLYFPIEWIMSFFTDEIITMNQEEFLIANKMHSKFVFNSSGVGINFTVYSRENKKMRYEQRGKYNLNDNDIVLISVGDLSKRKNHSVVIRALSRLNMTNIKYLIAGEGEERTNLERMINDHGLSKQVKLLGFQPEVKELYSVGDIFVFPSLLEGLPVSLLEAMAEALPCVVSDIAGNRDLIDQNGGVLVDDNSEAGYSEAIKRVVCKRSEWQSMGAYNQKKARKYDYSIINPELFENYMRVVNLR